MTLTQQIITIALCVLGTQLTEGLTLADLRLPVVSDGPFFSVLPEKKGEKRGAALRF